MISTLDALVHLDGIEQEHRTVLRRLESRRRRIRQQLKRIQQLTEQVDAIDEDIRRRQMDADRLDLDIKTRNSEIAKLRAQLNSVRTNREYSAILTQINTDKADGSKLEDQLLAVMTEVDEVRRRQETLETSCRREEEKLNELQSELADTEQACQSQLQEIEPRLYAARDGVPPSVLNEYGRALESHDGEALAEVLKPFPKRDEFVCGGCNMSVTLEQVNALRTRCEDIQYCHNCHRILYLSESAR